MLSISVAQCHNVSRGILIRNNAVFDRDLFAGSLAAGKGEAVGQCVIRFANLCGDDIFTGGFLTEGSRCTTGAAASTVGVQGKEGGVVSQRDLVACRIDGGRLGRIIHNRAVHPTDKGVAVGIEGRRCAHGGRHRYDFAGLSGGSRCALGNHKACGVDIDGIGVVVVAVRTGVGGRVTLRHTLAEGMLFVIACGAAGAAHGVMRCVLLRVDRVVMRAGCGDRLGVRIAAGAGVSHYACCAAGCRSGDSRGIAVNVLVARNLIAADGTDGNILLLIIGEAVLCLIELLRAATADVPVVICIIQPYAELVAGSSDVLGLGSAAAGNGAGIGANTGFGAGGGSRDLAAIPSMGMAGDGDIGRMDRGGKDRTVGSSKLEGDVGRACALRICLVAVGIAAHNIGIAALPEFGKGLTADKALCLSRCACFEGDFIGQRSGINGGIGVQRGGGRRSGDIEGNRADGVAAKVALLNQRAAAVGGGAGAVGCLRAKLPMGCAAVTAGGRHGRAEVAGSDDGIAQRDVVQTRCILNGVIDANCIEIEVILAVELHVESDGIGRGDLDIVGAVFQAVNLDHGDLIVVAAGCLGVVNGDPVTGFRTLGVGTVFVGRSVGIEEAVRFIVDIPCSSRGIDARVFAACGQIAVLVAAFDLDILGHFATFSDVLIATIAGDDLIIDLRAVFLGNRDLEGAGVIGGNGDNVEAGAGKGEADAGVLRCVGGILFLLGDVHHMDGACGILRIGRNIVVFVIADNILGGQAGGLLRNGVAVRQNRPLASLAVDILESGGVVVFIIHGGGRLDRQLGFGGGAVGEGDGVGHDNVGTDHALGLVGEGEIAVDREAVGRIHRQSGDRQAVQTVVCQNINRDSAVKVNHDDIVLHRDGGGLLAYRNLNGCTGNGRAHAAVVVRGTHAEQVDGEGRTGFAGGDIQRGRAVGILDDLRRAIRGCPLLVAQIEGKGVSCAVLVIHDEVQRIGGRAVGDGEVARCAAVVRDLRGVGHELDVNLIGRIGGGDAVARHAREGDGQDGILGDVGVVKVAACVDGDRLACIGVVDDRPNGVRAVCHDYAGLAVVTGLVVDNVGTERQDAVGRGVRLIDGVLRLGVRAGGSFIDDGGVGGIFALDLDLGSGGNVADRTRLLVLDLIGDGHEDIAALGGTVGAQNAGIGIDGHGGAGGLLHNAPRRLTDLRPVGIFVDIGVQSARQIDGFLTLRDLCGVNEGDLIALIVDTGNERVGVAEEVEGVALTLCSIIAADIALISTDVVVTELAARPAVVIRIVVEATSGVADVLCNQNVVVISTLGHALNRELPLRIFRSRCGEIQGVIAGRRIGGTGDIEAGVLNADGIDLIDVIDTLNGEGIGGVNRGDGVEHIDVVAGSVCDEAGVFHYDGCVNAGGAVALVVDRAVSFGIDRNRRSIGTVGGDDRLTGVIVRRKDHPRVLISNITGRLAHDDIVARPVIGGIIGRNEGIAAHAGVLGDGNQLFRRGNRIAFGVLVSHGDGCRTCRNTGDLAGRVDGGNTCRVARPLGGVGGQILFGGDGQGGSQRDATLRANAVLAADGGGEFISMGGKDGIECKIRRAHLAQVGQRLRCVGSFCPALEGKIVLALIVLCRLLGRRNHGGGLLDGRSLKDRAVGVVPRYGMAFGHDRRRGVGNIGRAILSVKDDVGL